MGIQRYNFSTIALEVARSTLMKIHGPKTKPNLLNTIDKFDRSAFPIRLRHQKTVSSGCQPSPQPFDVVYPLA
ncbi:hypothetical protein QUB70_27125 [Microcoleus sp. A003_D6]|uniref:hypothetical protein n=1 Tax=Microcoleus sp. A003_D6 TaxID=3055266 RepID=UPI002FD753BC